MFDTASFCGMDWFAGGQSSPPKPVLTTSLSDDRVDTEVSQGVPSLNVNDAWHLFGFPRKRATRDEVKKRYLALIVQCHPDRNMGDEKVAIEDTMGPKKRRKGKRGCKVIFLTPHGRAETSYPTCVKANIAAKAMRTAMRGLTKDARRGTQILVEKE